MQYIPAIIFGLTPLYLVRFGIFGIPATAFEVLLYVAFIAACVWAGKQGGLKNLFSLPQEKLFRAGLFLLALGGALSAVLHPTLQGLGILKGWFFDPFLFFLLIRSVGVYGEKDGSPGRKLFSVYALSGLCVAFIALGYAFFGSVTYDERLRAFFESPNHLAMVLSPVALIVLWRLLFADSQQKRARVGIGFGVLLLALYLTKSFGAWVGIAGALVFTGIATRVSRSVRMVLAGLAVLCGMLLPVLAVYYWPLLQSTFHIPERSSASSRMMIWRSAAEVGKDNAVFGIGPGNFQDQYLAEQKNYPPYLEWAVPQPHNIYLAFWLETGLLGLAGFLCLLWWFFKKTLFAPTQPAPYVFVAVAIMFYILFHGTIDTLYWKNDLSVVFWALLAVASAHKETFQNLHA